jgi:ATP-dependent RNA helicase RhlE
LTIESFRDFGLAESILRAVVAQGFTIPTPIQAAAIPAVLDGRDVMGLAQTGTGKTAAFGLPLLHHIAGARTPLRPFQTRALILAPTRELAIQIDESIRSFCGDLRVRTVTIYGGVGRRPQVDRMRRGCDIVIGTPGRVMDLMDTNELKLDAVTHFILDEADRMLDLGFVRDIRRVVAALPRDRQSLMFSATMPTDVAKLANGILNNPLRVEVSRDLGIAPGAIEQHVYFVPTADKRTLLGTLLRDPAITRAIVFTRTKHGANRVAEYLAKGGTRAEAIHGNKSQSARQRSLELFRSGAARVLVATDIAARGIDISDISHIINFDLPNVPESYVHRIGRTARAGATGIALSFCDQTEGVFLRDIERLTGTSLAVAGGTPFNGQRSNGSGRQGDRQPQQQNRQPNRGRRMRAAA